MLSQAIEKQLLSLHHEHPTLWEESKELPDRSS